MASLEATALHDRSDCSSLLKCDRSEKLLSAIILDGPKEFYHASHHAQHFLRFVSPPQKEEDGADRVDMIL